MYQSINPYTGEVIGNYEEFSDKKVAEVIGETHQTFLRWKQTDFGVRSRLMHQLAEKLLEKKEELAVLITSEMGKIITESVAEIEKCAWLCHHYADHAASMLKEEQMTSDGTVSYVRFDPTGIIYAIMPWNFPFWQVFRFAAPALMAGNVGILKHASNVPMCAETIENIFRDAGFPEGVFKNLVIPSKLVKDVIDNPYVKAATLTGSEDAGRNVAERSGRNLKKTVMELGGSDPFIVLEDANIDEAVNIGVRTASKLAQVVIGVHPDGIIGNKTLKALNKINKEEFLTKFKLSKIARYTYLCKKHTSNRKYLYGWIKRTLEG